MCNFVQMQMAMPKRIVSLVASAVVTLAFMAAFIGLGRWQWTAAFAHQQQLSFEVTSAPQPLSRLSTAEQWLPRTSIGALATAVGEFDFAHSFRTEPRRTQGGLLPWTVVPLKLRDGSVLAVVVGAQKVNASEPKTKNLSSKQDSAGQDSAAHTSLAQGNSNPVNDDLATELADDDAEILAVTKPSATVLATVVGRLQPSEDSPAIGRWQPSKDELATDTLTDRWSYPVVRDGYLVVTKDSNPRTPLATPRFISAPTGSIGWRNIAYAFQWWVFAIFAVFVWWRHVMESRGDTYPE
jgi:cytochrome oxidase assembly protein ShyY1